MALPPPVNSGFADSDPFVADDGALLIFASRRPNGNQSDIWTVPITGTTFGTAVKLDEVSTAGNNEYNPYLAGDRLYLTRLVSGNFDIYFSARSGEAGIGFGPAAPLEGVNTGGLEASPVVTSDERTIYFRRASDNVQPADIFRATRDDRNGTFANATPVVELNTAADDAPAWISADECTIVLTSKVNGHYDLFVARR
jgi:hypothetical protein